MKLAVLASGRGSNLRRILEACATGEVPARVAVVACNVPGAGALDVAAEHGVPALVLDQRDYPDRVSHERAVFAAIAPHAVDMVVLAGYMRVLSPWLVRHFPHIINLHPADPARYRGPDGYGWALAAGIDATAVTVHWVDEGLDTGPVIAMAPVPIYPGDDLASLRERGQAAEHQLFPRAIAIALDEVSRPCAAF